MKEWLEEHPDGLKDAFELHYKSLTHEAKKVCLVTLACA